MATNWSKSHFFDAGKNPPRQRVRHVDGQRRIEKIPNGTVRLFVTGEGNVVWQQLVPPGMPVVTTNVDAKRAQIRRRKGRWFEYLQCPLTTGALHLNDFPPELQRPCDRHDGKGPCPHVKHAVEQRQASHAAARTARHAQMRRKAAAAKAAQERATQAQEQLNENIQKLVERVAGNDQQAISPGKPRRRPEGHSDE